MFATPDIGQGRLAARRQIGRAAEAPEKIAAQGVGRGRLGGGLVEVGDQRLADQLAGRPSECCAVLAQALFQNGVELDGHGHGRTPGITDHNTGFVLVGLERESIKIDRKLIFGGVRTHPIISMFGFGCAWLYHIGVTFILPIGLLAIAVLTGIAYVAKIRVDRFGTTSEVSALLTFITGALAMLADVWIAMAMGIVNTMLLSEKAMLES